MAENAFKRMDSMNEQASNRLYALTQAFDFSEDNKEAFVQSMREMADFHQERSEVYRGICRQYGFTTEQIRTHEDVINIPHIFVTAFKQRRLVSLPDAEIFMTFTSSGTQGQKSQINLDRISFDRQAGMRELLVRSLGLTSSETHNYLVFSYAPGIADNRGAAHTFATYTTFAPAGEKYFALQQGTTGEPDFDLELAIEKLVRFAETGLPLRVVGFLAFSYITLQEMKQRGLRLQFPAESLLITGGGWKSHKGQTVSFEEYAGLVHEILGISPERIRDFYGMVEHGVPYMSCAQRHYHVPIFANVAAIDPGTLQVLAKEETGLLKLQTSYIRSAPAISVLSTDLGAIGSGCSCGIPGDYIMLRGRAGVTKHAGCAISASQLIKL
ncbi:MAG: acyl-protein synthetase [Deltaproteobacteria bacterium]|nr:acyl-protein synthetase [Deltaproteobacteria bacterium]